MTVTITAKHVFKEPVEVVAATHLGKFPNDYDPNIVACNTVERKKTNDGKNYTKRVALVRNVLPSLLKQVRIMCSFLYGVAIWGGLCMMLWIELLSRHVLW